MQNNKISIILTTFNRKEEFQNSLNSIINQENDNWELIIVNDGEVNLQKFIPVNSKIIYIKNEVNKGASASRNIGIKASHGEFIAYLDDDDEWMPNHLSISEDILNNYDFIYSGTKLRKNTKILPWYNEPFSYRKLAERNFITTSCVIHKKNMMEKVGYWNERLKCLIDWELWCRMLIKTSKIYHREEVTVIYNWSDESVTSRSSREKIRYKTINYIKVRYFFPLIFKHLFIRKFS